MWRREILFVPISVHNKSINFFLICTVITVTVTNLHLFLTRHLMTQRASWMDRSASSRTSLLDPRTQILTLRAPDVIPVICTHHHTTHTLTYHRSVLSQKCTITHHTPSHHSQQTLQQNKGIIISYFKDTFINGYKIWLFWDLPLLQTLNFSCFRWFFV